MLSTLLLVGAAISQATAATIRVDVGPGFTYSPDTITAAVGDVLEFHFMGGIHDVAKGDFNKACEPASSGGFYSGVFRPRGGEAADVFRVTVENTDPIFFYCSVEGHCSGGMVGVVNPSGSQSLDAYKNAAGSAVEVSPASVFGGEIGPASSFTNSGSDTGRGSASGSPTGAASTGAATGSPTGSSTRPTSPISVAGSSVLGASGMVCAALVGLAALAVF